MSDEAVRLLVSPDKRAALKKKILILEKPYQCNRNIVFNSTKDIWDLLKNHNYDSSEA